MHVKLKNQNLEQIPGVDIDKLNNVAKLIRKNAFLAVESAKSGHPGGSSSKTEQLVALLASGVIRFNPKDPKNPNRDRLVWSAGHCTPLLYGTLALWDKEINLETFRTPEGLPGHAESQYPLSDLCTGSSGHGLAGACGLATTHQSCGLDTRVFVMMGDAESEEGISYEARNLAKSLDLQNLFVSLDYNHYGIDGNINEVISSDYINHWLGFGWNVIEVDGHNILELIHAYKKAQEIGGPCVVLCHTIKGKHYGSLENSEKSHGKAVETEEYQEIIKNLETSDQDIEYFINLIHKDLPDQKINLENKPLVNPKDIKKPRKLPEELTFTEPIATRKASKAFFKWLMEQTSFLYAGSGDLAGSTYTQAAEDVYGIINKDNKYGRGIRFGIAEQNMAMLSSALTQDTLPGGFKPMSVFGTFGVFTPMMANSIRMSLIGNHCNPEQNGFFVALASHDGPETGEDGPTHQGMYWMSLFQAYPGIKVYKPLDANDLVAMMFYAIEKQEPVILSLGRVDTPVFEHDANLATQGAYILKDYSDNDKPKQVIAVCGGKMMDNLFKALPKIEENKNIKIIAVTSPELYLEHKPNIITEEERKTLITLHNGWKDFLNPFIMPENYQSRTLGINTYLKSGQPDDVYRVAGFNPEDLAKKIISI